MLVNQQLVWTTGRFLVAALRDQTNRWRNKQTGRSGRKRSVNKKQNKQTNKQTKKQIKGRMGLKQLTLIANKTGQHSPRTLSATLWIHFVCLLLVLSTAEYFVLLCFRFHAFYLSNYFILRIPEECCYVWEWREFVGDLVCVCVRARDEPRMTWCVCVCARARRPRKAGGTYCF